MIDRGSSGAECPGCDRVGVEILAAPMLGGSWRGQVVTRGGSDEVPHGTYSQEPLADGMSRAEWDRGRLAHHRSTDVMAARAATGITGTSYSHG